MESSLLQSCFYILEQYCHLCGSNLMYNHLLQTCMYECPMLPVERQSKSQLGHCSVADMLCSACHILLNNSHDTQHDVVHSHHSKCKFYMVYVALDLCDVGNAQYVVPEMDKQFVAIVWKEKEEERVLEIKDKETILGRGKLLQISDKKVSRNHACLRLLNDSVTISSTHVNPCFLNLKQRNKKVLLKQGGTITLEDGDEFTLLQNKYQFHVRIKTKANLDDEPNCNLEKSKIQSSSKKDSEFCKENYVHNTVNSETDFKVTLKTSPSATQRNNIKQFQHSSVSNVNEKKKRKLPQWMIDANKDSKKKITEHKTRILNTRVYDEVSHSLEEKCAQSENGEENVSLNQDLCVTDIRDVNTTQTTNSVLPVPTVLCISPAEENVASMQKPSSQKNEDVTSNKKDKRDSLTSNNTIEASSSASADIAVRHTSLKEVEVMSQSASNSNQDAHCVQHSVKSREACQYGAACYRKNPAHLEEFSHPGDTDYHSLSSDEDKPECEFGLQCYRKNPLHKKMFKHTRRVNPRRGAAACKPHDSSDEYDDSFIDDDETDEDVSEESDWEPSQKKTKNHSSSGEDDSEEITDLVDAAKNFTKNKKFWKK